MVKHRRGGFVRALGVALVIVSGSASADTGALDDARKLMTRGDFARAIEYFDRAIVSAELPRSELGRAFFDRGLANARLGRRDAARQDYRSAVTAYPALVPGWSSICYENVVDGRLDMALGQCNEALRLDPGHAPTYNIRAQLHYALGDTAAAAADYDRSVELDPGNWIARFNRGVFRDELGERDAAERDFRAAHASAPRWARREAPWQPMFKRYGIGE